MVPAMRSRFRFSPKRQWLAVPGSSTRGHELLVAVLLTATILVIAAGSAWSTSLQAHASSARWLALLALTAAAVGLAVRSAGLGPVTARERYGAQLGAALALISLASVFWSVDPKLTIERGASFVLVLITAVEPPELLSLVAT